MPSIIFSLLLLAAFYFLLVRPQQQRVRRQQALVNSIEVGDEVATAGGLIGVVTQLGDDQATLRVAPGVEITFLRFALARRLTAPAGPTAPDDDATLAPSTDATEIENRRAEDSE